MKVRLVPVLAGAALFVLLLSWLPCGLAIAGVCGVAIAAGIVNSPARH